MVLCMAQQSEERVCYEYMEHVWFHLVSATVESKFLAAIQGLDLKHFLVVRSKSYLDLLYREEVSTGDLTLQFGKRVFPEGKQQYVTCIGSFVLEIKVRKDFQERIDAFYQSVSSKKPLHAGRLTDFITERTVITLSVENNPKTASKIKKEFAQILGLSA